MNSHVFQKLGVASKANLNHIVQLFIFSVVFSGIFTMTNSAPLNSAPGLGKDFAFHKNGNNSYLQLPHETEPSYLFLHANNNMWLEILPDGTVKSNTCPTRYGALQSGSHSTKHVQNTKLGEAKKVADNAAVFLKGVISKRFLCVNEPGHIYASEEYNETDCAFIQRPQFEVNGSVVHYFKHLEHYNVYARRNPKKISKDGHKLRHPKHFHKVRFQLGFKKDGTVFIVKKHTQRKEKHKTMISINKVPISKPLEEFPEKCENQTQIPKSRKPKRRFKFCRKVWKKFFNASIKDLRRFRKYKCWDKLREMKNERRKRKLEPQTQQNT